MVDRYNHYEQVNWCSSAMLPWRTQFLYSYIVSYWSCSYGHISLKRLIRFNPAVNIRILSFPLHECVMAFGINLSYQDPLLLSKGLCFDCVLVIRKIHVDNTKCLRYKVPNEQISFHFDETIFITNKSPLFFHSFRDLWYVFLDVFFSSIRNKLMNI